MCSSQKVRTLYETNEKEWAVNVEDFMLFVNKEAVS